MYKRQAENLNVDVLAKVAAVDVSEELMLRLAALTNVEVKLG